MDDVIYGVWTGKKSGRDLDHILYFFTQRPSLRYYKYLKPFFMLNLFP